MGSFHRSNLSFSTSLCASLEGADVKPVIITMELLVVRMRAIIDQSARLHRTTPLSTYDITGGTVLTNKSLAD